MKKILFVLLLALSLTAGRSQAGIGAAPSNYNPAQVAISGGTISINNTSAGTGIYGTNTSTGYGVSGYNSSSGYGVYGNNASTGVGVYGYNSSTGIAVYGNTSGAGIGVRGYNSGSGYGVYGDKYNVVTRLDLNGVMLLSSTAPTIASGFGAGANVIPNGTAAFSINIGTGGTANSGLINMNTTATHAWSCAVTFDTLEGGAANYPRVTSTSSTQIGVLNIVTSTGAAVAWTAGDNFSLNCLPY